MARLAIFTMALFCGFIFFLLDLIGAICDFIKYIPDAWHEAGNYKREARGKQ